MALLAWIDRIRFRSSRDERGQTMAEYAVVLGVIVPGIIIALATISSRVATSIGRIAGFFS
jgi:Flp pilus assembly pilin Flp